MAYHTDPFSPILSNSPTSWYLNITKHRPYIAETRPALSQITDRTEFSVRGGKKMMVTDTSRLERSSYFETTMAADQPTPKRRVNKPACHHGECVFRTYCSPAALPASLGIIDGKAIRKEPGGEITSLVFPYSESAQPLWGSMGEKSARGEFYWHCQATRVPACRDWHSWCPPVTSCTTWVDNGRGATFTPGDTIWVPWRGCEQTTYSTQIRLIVYYQHSFLYLFYSQKQ